MILTTTSTIDGYKILNYKKMVQANIVIGANIFRDFAASFTDVFGGESDVYQRKLNKSYDELMIRLEAQAVRIGANAIVGIRVDFDEVSGGGKSMFMITAVGTAVILDSNDSVKKTINTSSISSSEIQNIIRFNSIKKSSDNNSYYFIYNNDSIAFLANQTNVDSLKILLNALLNINEEKTEQLLTESISTLIDNLDEQLSIDALYSYGNNDVIINIIRANKLLDLNKVNDLLDKDVNLAIKYLFADKVSYSKEDLFAFKSILSRIESLPVIWETKEVKSTFGKLKTKNYCSCGYEIEDGESYCYNCERNNKGITKTNVKLINKVKEKVDVLEMIFQDIQ